MCTFKETHKFRLRCVCGTHYHQTVPTFLFANNLQSTHINCCADDLFSFSPFLSAVNFATFVTSSSLIGNRLGTSTVLEVSACAVLCCACLREIPSSPVSLCVCVLYQRSPSSIFLHTITLWTLCSFLSWELCDPWAPDSHNQYHRRRRLCLITCCRTLSNQKQKKKKTLRPPPPPPPPRQSHTSLCDCSKRRQTVDLSSVCVCHQECPGDH